MTGQFPDPIAVPEDVYLKRHERLKQLVTSCVQGISVRSLIIVVELVGVWLFGSSALLMDALSSCIDVVASIFLVICLKLAARPPDEDHPFGHGRYEPLIGLQLGMLMALVGGSMFIQQVFQFSSETPQRALHAFAWVIPLGAVILLELSYQIVMRVAKHQNSPALAADAVHYRIDGLTSLCAAIALMAGAFYPEWSHAIDHIGAIFIAIIMVVIGIYALRQNLDQVVDRVPEKKYFDAVRAAACRVAGVRGTEKIRIQLHGPDAHIDIDVEVDPDLSVEVAHEISQRVRVEIQKDWPLVQDVIVHIEPFYPNDH